MLTTGEKRVVAKFNPNEDAFVAQIKRSAAELIDMTEVIDNTNSQTGRWKSLAMTAFEEGAMYAVKAATAGQDESLDE